MTTRRRLYLMRHGEVAYFDGDGRPLPEDGVGLTEEGRAQAEAAAALLARTGIDRVITSGLRRTVETAAIVSPGLEAEPWPDLRELRGARLSAVPEDELEVQFVHVFRGVVPRDRRFVGGETIGEPSTESSTPWTGCLPTRAGTPRSPCSTGASTAQSSRGR